MERLDKLLSATGRWSRREAKELLRQGRVTIEGRAVLRGEEKVHEGAAVLVDGEPLTLEQTVYLMLHKPAGVLSATEDRRQKTVLDLLPDHLKRVGLFPVGRLDKDTEGLLLLTNDGELAHRLLSPRKHVDKVYYARLDGPVGEEDIAAFAGGMVLEDGTRCLPAGLKASGENGCLVTLREGKFHQVKRMLAERGRTVRYLKRLSMGPLTLDEGLLPGQWRPLTQNELDKLEIAALREE